MSLERRSTPSISDALIPGAFNRFLPPAQNVQGQLGPDRYEFFHDAQSAPFDPTASEYSQNHAWYLSELAFLAYSSHNSTGDVEKEVTPALTRMFGTQPIVKAFIGHCPLLSEVEDQIQCIVAHDTTKGFVAFRGTLPQSPGNWLTDAKI